MLIIQDQQFRIGVILFLPQKEVIQEEGKINCIIWELPVTIILLFEEDKVHSVLEGLSVGLHVLASFLLMAIGVILFGEWCLLHVIVERVGGQDDWHSNSMHACACDILYLQRLTFPFKEQLCVSDVTIIQ